MGYDYVGPVAHSSGNGNLPIHRIVIHCTAGADAKGARGTARYFQMKEATGSAHAITDPNELVESAHDEVICWHAPPNTHSLGLEICCSQANQGKGHWELASHQKMLARAAKWTAEKAKKHGLPIHRLSVGELRRNSAAEGICGHVDVSLAFHQSTHEDPGPYFPWSQFMALVQAEYDKLTTPDAPSKEWDEMATEAQVQAAAYKANSQYAIDFWVKPTGTGTALIKRVNALSAAVVALGGQMTAEDATDDAALKAAVAELKAEIGKAIPQPPKA